MKLSQEEGIARLTPLLNRGKLIVFVGSGVSVPSGLPTWDGLLREFIAFCHSLPGQVKDDEFARLLSDAEGMTATYPTRVASALRDKLKQTPENEKDTVERYWKRWLNRMFVAADPNPAHEAVVGTNYPYIVTSNYDDLLEMAARSRGMSELPFNSFSFTHPEKVAAAIYEKRPCIIHAHGDGENLSIGDMIFTAEDYQRIRRDYPGFRLALQTLMLQYSMLFVGYGGSDPHLEDLLDEVCHSLGWKQAGLPEAFVFMKEEKVNSVHERYKEKRRTHFIVTRTYEDTVPFLKSLEDACPRLSEPEGVGG